MICNITFQIAVLETTGGPPIYKFIKKIGFWETLLTFEALGLGSSCTAQLKCLDMGATVNYSDLRNS